MKCFFYLPKAHTTSAQHDNKVVNLDNRRLHVSDKLRHRRILQRRRLGTNLEKRKEYGGEHPYGQRISFRKRPRVHLAQNHAWLHETKLVAEAQRAAPDAHD